MASQRPRRNNSPGSSKLQPLKATVPSSFMIRNPSPTRRKQSPSSPVLVGDGKNKCRRSPDVFPADHRSLVSPLGDKPKPVKLNLNMRRTNSMETLSSSYMNGQWPKENQACVCNKGTQTPQSWDESEEGHTQHKRSASLGSADTKKFKQYLQRTKQSQPVHGRQSPLQGDHSAIDTHLINGPPQTTRAIPIPSRPKTPNLHTRRSVEGLNTEIEKLVESHLNLDDGVEKPFDRTPPEGHRAPFPTLRSHDVDTQTENGQIDPSELITTSSNTSGLSSRSQSTSPSWPIAPGGITTESRTSSRCSSGGGRNQESESPENANGQSKFSSSPKPSFLARGPPDGAEKVPSHVENAYRKEKDLEAGLDTEDNSVLHGPDISKGKILFSQNTAFSPLPSKMKVNTRPSLIESNP